jgi:hypothetical protein
MDPLYWLGMVLDFLGERVVCFTTQNNDLRIRILT